MRQACCSTALREVTGSPVSSSCVADMLKELLRERLAVCPGWRHGGHQRSHLSGELRSSFGNQCFADCPPTSFDLLPRLKKLGLTGFNS